MPSSSMRIFYGEASEGLVAENVKIGDPLSLVISIDEQDIYGMHVTQCLVRDGLGWSGQGLINEEGCPQDYEIMGELEYSSSKTTALVKFQAHKFPYTSSVYYQCARMGSTLSGRRGRWSSSTSATTTSMSSLR